MNNDDITEDISMVHSTYIYVVIYAVKSNTRIGSNLQKRFST